MRERKGEGGRGAERERESERVSDREKEREGERESQLAEDSYQFTRKVIRIGSASACVQSGA